MSTASINVEGTPQRLVASELTAHDIASAAARIRAVESSRDAEYAARVADVMSRAVGLWRDKRYARRRDTISRIAHRLGYSVALLESSFDALLKPFTPEALASIAARISSGNPIDRPASIGFIMAGNVAGAGLHEIVLALIAGAGVVVKTASSEPIFFEEFARTLAEIDREIASRIAVFNWARYCRDLTSALIANCDRVVAYGDDATIDALHDPGKVIGFGSRASGAVVAAGALVASRIERVVEMLAHDVVLFEQLGCLSPHQVYVVADSDVVQRDFARRTADALERLAPSMPPARVPFRDAAEIRGVRERARWRRIAGEPVELFEGAHLEWTVVFEPDLSAESIFKVSPGFRTVYVNGARDLASVRERIADASKWIEAIAVAGSETECAEITSVMRALGVPYICAPGQMQSPVLEWRHGGGAFFDLMVGSR